MSKMDTTKDNNKDFSTLSTPKQSDLGLPQVQGQKRSRKEMDPDSPLNIVGLKDVLNDVMGPVQFELASIRTFMSNTNKKLDTIARLQDQIISLSKENESLKKKVDALEAKVESLTERPETSGFEVTNLKEENRLLKEQIIANESQARRVNLVFTGVQEAKGEVCEETILHILAYAGFDFDIRSFERAHRLGPYNKHKIRPIIVRFHHYLDRQSVWMARRYIKEACQVVVVEDYPQLIRDRRKILYPILNAAVRYRDEEFPDFRYRAHLNVDKLIINGSSYTVDSLDKLPKQLKPELSSSPTKDDKLVFFSKASPLSNHHPSSFNVSGTEYNCMEQFLMEAKALYFDDQDTATAIMDTKDPVQQKRLGKSVRNFDLSTWQNAVPDILETGLMAKFSQVDHCRDFLLSTGGKTLAEANPSDSFFGIGMGLRHPDVWDVDLWGKNLLGKKLMDVRNSLT